MKVYIIKPSVGDIKFAGIERCFVLLSKPKSVLVSSDGRGDYLRVQRQSEPFEGPLSWKQFLYFLKEDKEAFYTKVANLVMSTFNIKDSDEFFNESDDYINLSKEI